MKHEWPLLASSLVLVGLLVDHCPWANAQFFGGGTFAGDSIVHDDFSVTTYCRTSAGETFVVVLDHRTNHSCLPSTSWCSSGTGQPEVDRLSEVFARGLAIVDGASLDVERVRLKGVDTAAG